MPPPSAPVAPTGLRMLGRLRGALLNFLRSEVGPKAWLLIGLLLLLMLCINGMNVANSYVGRDFMSAIEMRDRPGFVRYAWTYVAVFVLSTLVGVWFRFAEERLALLWREWLTRRAVTLYLDRRAFLHLKESGAMSNPDQRISEDIRALTVSTISFTLMILNGTVTALSFSGVLWSISPKLFVVAVLYAAAGSTATILLGRPLIRLNYQQSDREADFRSELIRVREDAEGIACAGCEPGLRSQLLARIDGVVGNLRRIIAVNRNVGFFTTGYNYLIQLIPALLVAPLFIDGQIEFGIIGQSAMAFATLLGAFSLVVTQFQAISSYASVVTRVSEATNAMEQYTARAAASRVRIEPDADVIRFEKLTLHHPDDPQQVVLCELEGTLRAGRRCLITGPNEAAGRLLFRTAADLHEAGSGWICRPPPGRVAFLPERPFLPPVALRQLLDPAVDGKAIDGATIDAVLAEAGLAETARRLGGLDTPHDWDDTLSTPDQHLLAVARVALARPAFAFLERPDATLDAGELERALKMLECHGVTCIMIAGGEVDPAAWPCLLEVRDDGTWHWTGPADAAA